MRILDRLVIAAAVLAACYMALRGPALPVNDLLPGGRPATVVYCLTALLLPVALVSMSRAGRWTRLGGRVVLYLLALVLVTIGFSRAMTLRQEARNLAVPVWPPRPGATPAQRLTELTPAERASWGVHVAIHVLADSVVRPLPLVLPADWPFPEDVEIATHATTRGTTEVWARASDGTAACLTVPARMTHGADSVAQQAECATRTTAPDGLQFSHPTRGADAAPATRDTSPAATPWVQHRGDGARRGITTSPIAGGAGWSAQIDGPIRASASIVGDVVLIGTHDTGVLEAFDLRTGTRRWMARVPNWIHQDAVSDGRIVVVGFGNIWESFAGRAPSGVAAFALADGRRLWTSFDENSVMTSPVIFDTTLIYSTAAGTLRKRSLRTGALLATRQLPGGVIMGPPAIHGDTVAISLDEAGVCAVLASTFEELWCRRIPGMRMLGHAAPTIADGMILSSGPGLLRAASLHDFMALPPSKQMRLIVGAASHAPGFVGQRLTAYATRDGRTLWTSPFYDATRDVAGHSAGTATVVDGIGVIILPFADTLIAFRARTGDVLWSGPGHRGRGAPLVVDGRVVVAGRDGVIETRDLATGALRCTTHRAVGYDRAGPAMAGGLLVFADLNGRVEAMPRSAIVDCANPAP